MKFSILTTVGALLTLAATATARRATRPSIINLAHRADADPITITCTNKSIDYVDGQSAAKSLGDYCTSHGPMTPSTKISWTAGKTRVYGCNWSSTATASCNQDEIVKAQNAIMGQCGVRHGRNHSKPHTGWPSRSSSLCNVSLISTCLVAKQKKTTGLTHGPRPAHRTKPDQKGQCHRSSSYHRCTSIRPG